MHLIGGEIQVIKNRCSGIIPVTRPGDNLGASKMEFKRQKVDARG